MRLPVLLATLLLVPASAAQAAPKARLAAFEDCAQLARYAHRHAPAVLSAGGIAVQVARPATGGPGPAPPLSSMPTAGREDASDGSTAFSTTNNQEAGVDEPDTAKTDGARLYALAGRRLQVLALDATAPRLLGSVALDGQELLVSGNRVLVLGTTYTFSGVVPPPTPAPVPDAPTARAATSLIAPGAAKATFTEVDVSDPRAPRIVRTVQVDGSYLSARLHGTTARVVVTSTPPTIALPELAPGTTERGAARRAIAASAGRDWLPKIRIANVRAKTVAKRSAVPCRQVRRPPAFSGMGMLSVLTLDLRKGIVPVDEDAVMTDGDTVYASPTSLYVATERWADVQDAAEGDDAAPRSTTTVHRFELTDDERTTYRSSGSVGGYLLNQFALSERDGVLRVASTEDDEGGASAITTLREQGGALVRAGRVGGLGAGERVYAVRFIDDLAYVVTFRQTDPLYTVDLSVPEAPKVLGELGLLGYSAYLHPAGDGLLLGIGQDASPQGRTEGAQVSLFDVSDPRTPKLLQRHSLGALSSSEAEWDHHAFLFWPATGLTVVPVWREDFHGAIGLAVDRAAGIREAGRVTHPDDAMPTRSLVAQGRLWTVSQAGVRASTLEDLRDVAWVPFASGG